MPSCKEIKLKDDKVVVNWLAHHNPNSEDFDDHVFYIFKYAICIGCFAFILGVIIALTVGNLFYNYIVNFISFPSLLIFFLICWLPSIVQYSIQIARKISLTNRIIKFTSRILYPIGSILLIFKSPLWGFIISVPAGYFIIIIRKIKNKSVIKD